MYYILLLVITLHMYLKKRFSHFTNRGIGNVFLSTKPKVFQSESIFIYIPLEKQTNVELLLPIITLCCHQILGDYSKCRWLPTRKGRDLLEAGVPGCWGGIRPLTLPPTHTDAHRTPPWILLVPLQSSGFALCLFFCHFETPTGAASWSTCPRRSGSAPIKKVGSLLHVNTTGLQQMNAHSCIMLNIIF